MILTPPRAPTINQGLRIVNGMYGDQLEGMRLSIAVPGEPDFADRMQRAFEFLRRYASNHYTPSSLIKVMSAAEWTRHSGDGPPMLIDIETPFSFDPETEVKTGGKAGVLVQLNDGTGRALCAVASQARRKGAASAMVLLHRHVLGPPTFWVGRTNARAQSFLLKNEFFPVQMNARGALRYSYGTVDPEGQEE